MTTDLIDFDVRMPATNIVKISDTDARRFDALHQRVQADAPDDYRWLEWHDDTAQTTGVRGRATSHEIATLMAVAQGHPIADMLDHWERHLDAHGQPQA